MNKIYNCIILSTKSAGSSALQKFLVQDYGFKMTEKVRHHENETLFWTKAASVLGLHQQRMHRSKVPYSKAQALEGLQHFCEDNKLGNLAPDNATKETFFSLYARLVEQNQPRFVEKSPHHLYNQSNLDLIAEFIDQHRNEIDFKVIGLIRHPLSVIYSGWERWKFDCGQFEKEWLTSNQNLLNNKSRLEIEVVRYEDLVAENGASMQEKLNLTPVSKDFHFRSSSLYKWKTDRSFGHELSEETKHLAAQFGYGDFETPGDKFSWKLKSLSTSASAGMKQLLS